MANSDFSQSQRNTIWNNQFGNANSGYDVFGRLVTRNDYEVDHIFPKSLGGKTIVDNGQVLHPLSNQEKSDNLSGYINGRQFRISYYNGIGQITVN